VQELRDLARSDAIASFVADPPLLLAEEFVHGVTLVVDRFWLRAFRAAFGYWTEGSPVSFSYRTRRVITGHKFDFTWRPDGWAAHCAVMGYPDNAHPVAVLVLLRSPVDTAYLSDVPRSVDGHSIRYEYRPPCVAYGPGSVAAGAQISRGVPPTLRPIRGTVGGFLHDRFRVYAVSCAHVFGPVGSVISQSSGRFAAPTPVADVTFASMPTVSSETTKCNRIAQAAIPDLDVALAALQHQVTYNPTFPTFGTVDHVSRIADMTGEDEVSFLGANRGRPVPGRLGDLNVWREILIEGRPHCMGDLFTMKPRQHAYVRTELAKPGDSGAWVVSLDNGVVSWDGMVIAGDGPDVYCAFAEHVLATCRSANPGLVLPTIAGQGA
jgi:hypothetical protein